MKSVWQNITTSASSGNIPKLIMKRENGQYHVTNTDPISPITDSLILSVHEDLGHPGGP